MSEAVRDADGSKYIPATQRPDGTWRKPRRVKDGYVPQEEVPLYESKGKQFATRSASTIPVGLTAEIVAEAKAKAAKKEAKEKSNMRCPIPGLIIQVDESKKKKNKKSGIEEVTSVLAKTSLNASGSNAPGTDPAKRLKNLKKKLRDTEVLEAKINSGQLENPEKDQLEKVKNKQNVIDEIAKLEAML